MPAPTREDAQIMLQLAQYGAQLNVNEAAAFIWSEKMPKDFEEYQRRYPHGEPNPEAGLVHRILGWYETVGTLYRNGLINEDLLFDWLAISSTWERVAPIARGMREEAHLPALWENFEFMAERQKSWKPTRK